jgi:hypothetical protein
MSDNKKYEKIVELAETLELDVVILVGPDGNYSAALVGEADFVEWFQKNVEKTASSTPTVTDDDPSDGTFH